MFNDDGDSEIDHFFFMCVLNRFLRTSSVHEIILDPTVRNGGIVVSCMGGLRFVVVGAKTALSVVGNHTRCTTYLTVGHQRAEFFLASSGIFTLLSRPPSAVPPPLPPGGRIFFWGTRATQLQEEQLFIDTMLTINTEAFRLQQAEGTDIG